MEWPTKAVDWAIIFGTIFTGLLALYAYCGDWLRKKRNSPKLRVELHEPWGHNTKEYVNEITTAGPKNSSINARYYSIRVWNDTKATEAKRVRARVLFLIKKNSSGIEKVTPPAPLHFIWAATPGDDPPYLSYIPTYDNFSIGRVWENEDHFLLKTNPTRASFPGKILRGETAIVVIEVLSENALQPVQVYLQIDWREPTNSDLWGSTAPFITKISEREFKRLTQKEQTTCAVK